MIRWEPVSCRSIRFLDRTGPIAERLTDSLRAGRPDTLFQSLLERVPALLEMKPTNFGYRHAEWTVELLRVHLREEGIEASDATMRRALHESGYRWKRPRFVLRRRSETWRQSKGAPARLERSRAVSGPLQ